ncbi:MAG TPA: GC-type dockerin domain-anchored protein [Phycisphaerales bacterium]|nr:GC-type dockerin domain-anchored protein [Phycisphaerales bacterium]
MSRTTTQPIAIACMLIGTASAALAQANFSESFQNLGGSSAGSGGPAALVSRGWAFRNQSNPSNGASPYWSEFPAWGQVGSGLGHGGFATWQDSSTRISAWGIPPAIANQIAGDPPTLWTAAPTDAVGINNPSLEVRYSPTGATGTGSSSTDVGSFTQLLAGISGAGGHAWTQRTMSLPGSGRIAIRLVNPPAASSFDFAGTFVIDSLRVGNPPPLPYPVPVAGQTVHWTTAMSPVTLSTAATGQSPRIVPGGTVIVDPGVEVRVGNSVVFDVSGTLVLQGTAAQPVRLRGNTGYAAGWARMSIGNGGLVTGTFVDVETYTDLLYGGKASFTDSAFRDPSLPTDFSYDSAGDIGHRFFDGSLAYQRQILSLTRCTFGQGCDVALLRGWLAARDCTFYRGGRATVEPGAVGGEAMYIVGSTILDNVTVTEGYIDLVQDHHQRRYIGNVTVNGNPYGPGIRLEGGASYLIDPSVSLQGNKWPVSLGINSAGILPGSRLPAAGNQFNEIPDTDDAAPIDERVVWADAGIPYILRDNGNVHGRLTVLPGVTIKAPPDIAFQFTSDSNGLSMPVFLGEPERPIRFMPHVPGTKWRGIGIGTAGTFGTRWDWCVVEDSTIGIASAELPIALDNCTFRRNTRAVGGDSLYSLRKCTFENNVFSYSGERFAPNHTVEGYLDANHPANPNTFINNRGAPGAGYFGTFLPNGGLIARARHNSLENTDSDVRNNWWGTTDGPHHPTLNPFGTGDDVFFGIDNGGFLVPFLVAPPTANPPPVVRFVSPPMTVNPGEKIHLHWTARDDGRIVTQKVLYSADTNLDWAMQPLAEIPASARSSEWTPPVIGTPANGADQFIRVIAVDDLGQEGIADLPVKIANTAPFTGSMVPTAPLGGAFRPGESFMATATVTPVVGSTYAVLELDNDESAISQGTFYVSGNTGSTILPVQLPDVSTDRARIRYDATGALNQARSFYGPYFSIRPDPMLGDAAPVVSITSEHTGQSYPGGSTIALSWTASDDEALRGFDVRASFDGGTRWFIVARDLPAEVRSYSWRLPGSAGIPSVRVRVVAWDRRFQNTSAESGVFAITAGAYATPCPADFNGDGALAVQDIFDFLNAWLAGSPSADFSGGGLAVQDIFDFLNAWFAGC